MNKKGFSQLRVAIIHFWLTGRVHRYQNYLPLMSLVLEQFDLRGYNLAISSEFGPAKGVIARADTMHICYCHSPISTSGIFIRIILNPRPR